MRQDTLDGASSVFLFPAQSDHHNSFAYEIFRRKHFVTVLYMLRDF